MAHLFGTQELGAIGGSRKILGDISVSVADGDRIGVLGPNGAGKTTLLDMLAGVREPDSGRMVVREGVTFAHLSQRDLVTSESVVSVVHPGLAAHEWASEPAIRDIHEGLLSDIDLESPVSELSGGQRRRVNLARVLSAGVVEGHPADVLVLDEPTNHLDVEGVAWLARHLNERMGPREGAGKNSGALIVVTHDRWFLDAVCTHVWEVVPGIDPGGDRPQIAGRIETYEGSYAAYILARAERARQSALAAQKRQNLLRKELAWLRRGAPARTSKPRFRIEAAEELIANEPPPRDEVELVRMATARLGKQVVDLENVSLSFGEGDSRRQIFEGITYRLAPAERVGIVGVNGAGKTTLLRLLNGSVAPDSGRVKRGKTVKVATLSQDTHELDEVAHRRVVESVADIAQSMIIGGKEVSASQLVERIGFTRERAWTPISKISGGERRRLQLVRLLMSEPNVILLDEPTNDLDTDTLAAMEDLLDTFPGTLVVVSHDRYLLERTTTHQLALFGDGQLRAIPGGVEQYLEMRAQGMGGVAGRGVSTWSEPAKAKTVASETSRVSDAQAFREAQKEARRIERQMSRLASEIESLEAQLGDLASNMTPEGIAKLAELSEKLT
ncbi:MAG: ABC-F family ATP-binding cassette domain-containing protein, partial [Actinomycetaceae bacterium]|nr:ABC-F family ATP-binding cassette domain-containing protein [Actinomycetaceae bacterium]